MRENGLVYGPSPELYNGLAGFYTYGPLGRSLKVAIENFLRKHFQRYQFWEVEVPTIMPEIVWKASGHVDNFTDPVVKCKKCGAIFRVDNLIEEQLNIEVHTIDEMKRYVKDLKCPSCGGSFDENIEMVSLMLKTTVGYDTVAYARPETATTTYLPFQNYYYFFRRKLPFGVFQIGKAYRNEISPRQHLLRCREFTQAEAQLFIFGSQKESYGNLERFDFKMNLITKNDETLTLTPKEAYERKIFGNKAYAFAIAITYESFLNIGISNENLSLRQHKDDEKAFYALDAWDVEIKLNTFNWTEVCGVHDRGDYDLTQHSKFSKQELSVFNEDTKRKEIPHIIEIAYGVDRIFFSVLDQAYDYLEKEEGKTTLRINKHIAPIQVAVFPLLKKEELKNKAKEIYETLLQEFSAIYDESGAIGRRYLRANKMGIPYAVTIDFQTLQDSTVTIRERDSERQIRIKIEQLKDVLHKLLTDKNFDDFKQYEVVTKINKK